MTSATLRVLTVCTANICRSPVAERLLQREFDEARLPAIVRSAGTRGGELEIVPEVVRAASEFGIDLSAHKSRLLTGPIVRSADLIIAMSREHLRVVIDLDPSAWPVTFTIKEIARRSELLLVGSLTMSEWLAKLNSGRKVTDLLGDSPVDDLFDPYGGSYADYRRMVAEIYELTTVHPVSRL